MKKTLLFKRKFKTITALCMLCFCFNYGFSQTNLVQNGTADEYTIESDDTANGLTKNVDDNADAWDMTPNSKVFQNDGTEVDSPYTWSNSDLADWLASNCGDADEQPGSTSDGNYVNGEKTRGVKINEACRRLYQEVAVTIGTEYTFSIESRSEAEGVPSEVFMLNTAIDSEATLSSTSTEVDGYMLISNDFNEDKSNATTNNFTTTTFSFTATTSKVIIYVRAPLAVDSDNEVFYDNLELRAVVAASVKDVFADNISMYPNPANNFINISTPEEISSVEVYNIVGKRVLSIKNLKNNQVDISNLSSGMYMLRLTNGTSIATKKIIKQ